MAEPSGPSPEVRAKLMQLRDEFAKRAEEQRRRQLGQQNMEEALKRNKLPIAQAGSPVEPGSISVDDMRQQLMAKGGSVKEPKNTVKAYKLFRVHEKHPGKLFPLFVDANTPVEMGKWIDAKSGEMKGNKVKSKIGPLAYRPGWHAGDVPVATHIGEKSDPANMVDMPPDTRPHNHVWAEIEMPNDVDWQSVANERGMNPKGKLIAREAHITDQIPKGGHYRYKTNSNMTGNWLIGGSMKVNRILGDKEVERINNKAGVADLPRAQPFNKKAFGFAAGGVVAPDEWKAEEHVNYKRSGGPTHAHHLDIEERPL